MTKPYESPRFSKASQSAVDRLRLQHRDEETITGDDMIIAAEVLIKLGIPGASILLWHLLTELLGEMLDADGWTPPNPRKHVRLLRTLPQNPLCELHWNEGQRFNCCEGGILKHYEVIRTPDGFLHHQLVCVCDDRLQELYKSLDKHKRLKGLWQ